MAHAAPLLANGHHAAYLHHSGREQRGCLGRSTPPLRLVLVAATAVLFVCACINLMMHAASGNLQREDVRAGDTTTPYLRRPLQRSDKFLGHVSSLQRKQPVQGLEQQASAWRPFPFANQSKYRLYYVPLQDASPRCRSSGICDGNHTCASDGLGCITATRDRLERIRQATKWSWAGYRRYAWGEDEVGVLDRYPLQWFNMGLTIVDSIDTLLLMGLQEEYDQARHWVANRLHWEDNRVQFFEVTIRILGGLISAYHLSGGDDMYRLKAVQLAERLMPAFNTTLGVPLASVLVWEVEPLAAEHRFSESDPDTNLAEAGSNSMEFTSLARMLGRKDMHDASMGWWHQLHKMHNVSGLYCQRFTVKDLRCINSVLTLGASADSMYEYMLKQWLLAGKQDDELLQLYKGAVGGMRRLLLREVLSPEGEPMAFVTQRTVTFGNELILDDPYDDFEHLTCFVGGMLALGHMHGVDTRTDSSQDDDLVLAAKIGRACYELYRSQPTGLSADVVVFSAADGSHLPFRQQKRVLKPSAEGAFWNAVENAQEQSFDTAAWVGLGAGAQTDSRSKPDGAKEQQRTQDQQGQGPTGGAERPGQQGSATAQGSSTRRLLAADAGNGVAGAIQAVQPEMRRQTPAEEQQQRQQQQQQEQNPRPVPMPVPEPPMLPQQLVQRPAQHARGSRGSAEADAKTPATGSGSASGSHGTHSTAGGKDATDDGTSSPWLSAIVKELQADVAHEQVAGATQQHLAHMLKAAAEPEADLLLLAQLALSEAQGTTPLSAEQRGTKQVLLKRVQTALAARQQQAVAAYEEQTQKAVSQRQRQVLVQKLQDEAVQAFLSKVRGQALASPLAATATEAPQPTVNTTELAGSQTRQQNELQQQGEQPQRQLGEQEGPAAKPASKDSPKAPGSDKDEVASLSQGLEDIAAGNASGIPAAGMAAGGAGAVVAKGVPAVSLDAASLAAAAAQQQAEAQHQAAGKQQLGTQQGAAALQHAAAQQAAMQRRAAAEQAAAPQQQAGADAGDGKAAAGVSPEPQIAPAGQPGQPCGPRINTRCAPSECCSWFHQCGTNANFCGAGCQAGWGRCSERGSTGGERSRAGSTSSQERQEGQKPWLDQGAEAYAPIELDDAPLKPQKAVLQTRDGQNHLRPEAVETLFYLWRATGDPVYREWGWSMFRAFEKWLRAPTGGYSGAADVAWMPPMLSNKQESFWVAETLKYFYLLFSDDANLLPLDRWVFNTEAHPFPVWGTQPDKLAIERLQARQQRDHNQQKHQQLEQQAAADEQTAVWDRHDDPFYTRKHNLATKLQSKAVHPQVPST